MKINLNKKASPLKIDGKARCLQQTTLDLAKCQGIVYYKNLNVKI